MKLKTLLQVRLQTPNRRARPGYQGHHLIVSLLILHGFVDHLVVMRYEVSFRSLQSFLEQRVPLLLKSGYAYPFDVGRA